MDAVSTVLRFICQLRPLFVYFYSSNNFTEKLWDSNLDRWNADQRGHTLAILLLLLLLLWSVLLSLPNAKAVLVASFALV